MTTETLFLTDATHYSPADLARIVAEQLAQPIRPATTCGRPLVMSPRQWIAACQANGIRENTARNRLSEVRRWHAGRAAIYLQHASSRIQSVDGLTLAHRSSSTTCFDLRLLRNFHPCFGHGNYGFAILRIRSSLQQCRTLINVALAFFDRFFWHHVH